MFQELEKSEDWMENWKCLPDILFSYLYPFRSVKDMKGRWGIFYGLSHVFMAVTQIGTFA